MAVEDKHTEQFFKDCVQAGNAMFSMGIQYVVARALLSHPNTMPECPATTSRWTRNSKRTPVWKRWWRIWRRPVLFRTNLSHQREVFYKSWKPWRVLMTSNSSNQLPRKRKFIRSCPRICFKLLFPIWFVTVICWVTIKQQRIHTFHAKFFMVPLLSGLVRFQQGTVDLNLKCLTGLFPNTSISLDKVLFPDKIR